MDLSNREIASSAGPTLWLCPLPCFCLAQRQPPIAVDSSDAYESDSLLRQQEQPREMEDSKVRNVNAKVTKLRVFQFLDPTEILVTSAQTTVYLFVCTVVAWRHRQRDNTPSSPRHTGISELEMLLRSPHWSVCNNPSLIGLTDLANHVTRQI
jgi:hypothetical protein